VIRKAPLAPSGDARATGVAPRVEGEVRALSIRLEGVVQGVGFRPYVDRMARAHSLRGWVRNRSGDVEIHVEGKPERLEAFRTGLAGSLPPLARIDRLEAARCEPRGIEGFSIQASSDEPDRRQPISPDVATCAACEAELRDPVDRRYGYPFITCTDCGPRFTVIEAMPYDRERTSMAAFRQCPECLTEYRTPGNRRYHSQTNSCGVCGPRVWLEEVGARRAGGGREEHGMRPGPGEATPAADPVDQAARLLTEGRIVALRGLGGFHLAVDAGNEEAVVRLRERKGREAKPLAVMVASLEAARVLADPVPAEEALLRGPERPIVLVRIRPGAPLAPSLAPGLDRVGMMLAYTPLHHLLLERTGRPLVMTSGNASDEPIATGNEEARRRLSRIADAFLFHDREIVARYDDSVVRTVGDRPIFLRRARGYAPLPLSLPVPAPVPLLAVGPHLKNTFTLAHGRDAWVSQHIGDLESVEALEHFRDALDRFRRLFRVEPRMVVRDLHPGYLSSRIAEEMEEELGPALTVQHHHAHIAAVLAEHGRTDPVVGLAFDGVGLGDDGTVWGAELLVADLAGYRRAGHLRPAPLPGGDLAARNPWRAALGYLRLKVEGAGDADGAGGGEGGRWSRAFQDVPSEELRVARLQTGRGLNSPLASSMGRLFDAAAAILGVRSRAFFEGQAAMELEALAGDREAASLPFPVTEGEGGTLTLEPLPLLDALARGIAEGRGPGELAAAFHDSLARGWGEAAARIAEREGLGTVALGGGVFQNARLTMALSRELEARGLQVLRAEKLSPNDGGVSYGQAAVAAARLADDRPAPPPDAKESGSRIQGRAGDRARRGEE
jgi:hydrogenase maturation protein HypF